MNTRRIHQLMKDRFPRVDAATQQWTNVLDRHGQLIGERASTVLVGPFTARGLDEVLVLVHRNLGARIAAAALPDYVAQHVREGDIRIADRAFTVFARVTRQGIATAWTAQDTSLISPSE